MIRSTSEWEFEKFLQEATSSSSIPKTAGMVVVSKGEDGEEVKEQIVPPPLKVMPAARDCTDPAFLKQQLDLACAAAANALYRTSNTKIKESSPSADSRSHDFDNPQMGSQASVKGKVTVSNVQIRPVASSSSQNQSDDDEFEGEAETTENMNRSDAKRIRRMEMSMSRGGLHGACEGRTSIPVLQNYV